MGRLSAIKIQLELEYLRSCLKGYHANLSLKQGYRLGIVNEKG